ncbi:MAG: AGE family epimerase/isomerase [Fermentimonas sp.]|nr:AGE family epimerase/isomerase [Fermentimonas sp.]
MKHYLILFITAVQFIACTQKFSTTDKLNHLAVSVEENLYENIVPFWLNHSIDSVNGGFFGTVDIEGNGDPEADKGLILNSRILWTFSSLYLKDGDENFLSVADRAFKYIEDYFIDKEFGGGVYTVDYTGTWINETKSTYANSFLIYGLSEYVLATGNQTALYYAQNTFLKLEENAHDSIYGGYGEIYNRDWTPVADGTRNEIGDAAMTMNTSLHVLESLTNMYRVWKSPVVKDRLQEMIIITLEKIINTETNRQFYFFDRDWKSIADIKSYGHDIECSWLLFEAAEVLGNKELTEKVKKASIAMAESTLEALNQDGSLTNETINGEDSKSLQWWVQAEAVVGFINAWQLTNDEVWIDRALSVWKFTEDNFVDKEYGEWFWGFGNDGQLNKGAYKISAWKAPYHNSRMCTEVLRRLSQYR